MQNQTIIDGFLSVYHTFPVCTVIFSILLVIVLLLQFVLLPVMVIKEYFDNKKNPLPITHDETLDYVEDASGAVAAVCCVI